MYYSKNQFYPYSLISSQGVSRQGALLRIETDQWVGYADCFPWPSLGDAPLREQLQALKCQKWTPLLKRSWILAEQDGIARAQQRSLWKTQAGRFLKIPKNHFFIQNLNQVTPEFLEECSKQGFRYLKWKYSLSQDREKNLKLWKLNQDVLKRLALKVRLDWNSLCPSVQAVEEELWHWKFLLEEIDFIEDPCPYSALGWTHLQKSWPIRLALDHKRDVLEIKPGSCSVLILKPAIEDPEKVLGWARSLGVPLVVTSYLDHPLGQLFAAWVAATIADRDPQQIETCGLLSHLAYEKSVFSEGLRVQGASLFPPLGLLGLGYDSFLETLTWIGV